MTATVEVERDRHGIRWTKHGKTQGGPRPYIADPNTGKETPYLRVTSFIDVLEETGALTAWYKRTVLLGAAVDDTFTRQATAYDPEDPNGKRQLNDLAAQAFVAGGGEAKAERGTALHALTELVDSGEPADMVDSERADLRAYWQTCRRHGLRMLDMERRVVVDDLKVTGTFDRLVEHQSRRRIFDLKTGRVDYGRSKMAMQLALYAHGVFYDGRTRERTPMDGVDQEVGLICHLPAGKAECTIYEVDLRTGWEGVQLAARVRDWRRRDCGFSPLWSA